MFDVTAIGELLIDFSPAGQSVQNNPLFEQNPGGAPANVLACLSKLGKQTAFIGKVGADQFGVSLKNTLKQVGVSSRGLIMSEDCHTSLAFVHLSESGDRSFSFYRDPGADLLLTPQEIDHQLIDESRIFHFGSVSMTGEPARSATLAAVKYAREQGKLISYDPNLRIKLWRSEEEAREVILSAMPLADIVKISEEELTFLTDETDLVRGSHLLLDTYDLKLILITLGPDGAYVGNGKAQAYQPAYAVKTVDTTGAGDAFTGGFLFCLLQSGKSPDQLTENDLNEFVSFGNATGSLATMSKGAIPSLPTLEQVEECRRTIPFEKPRRSRTF